jgi:hypothetical protein
VRPNACNSLPGQMSLPGQQRRSDHIHDASGLAPIATNLRASVTAIVAFRPCFSPASRQPHRLGGVTDATARFHGGTSDRVVLQSAVDNTGSADA